MATSIDAWVKNSEFISHVYTEYDDRDEVETREHLRLGKIKGAAYAAALNRHTENNANFFYSHWAAEHYDETPAWLVRGDDSVNEIKHKFKRAQKHRVFTGGRRKAGEKWSFPVRVQKLDAHDAVIPGQWETRYIEKAANRADFEVIQRREAVVHMRGLSKLPKLITTSRAQFVKSEHAEKRTDAQQKSRSLMKAMLKPENAPATTEDGGRAGPSSSGKRRRDGGGSDGGGSASGGAASPRASARRAARGEEASPRSSGR